MTDRTFIIAVCIANIPPTVAATAGVIAVLRGQKKTTEQISGVRGEMGAMHEGLNGRMSQLLKAENAQGRQDERDSQGKDE